MGRSKWGLGVRGLGFRVIRGVTSRIIWAIATAILLMSDYKPYP